MFTCKWSIFGKNNKNFAQPPLPPTVRKIKNYVDFNMAANENALTQPKFELGINGIIQNVFHGD